MFNAPAQVISFPRTVIEIEYFSNPLSNGMGGHLESFHMLFTDAQKRLSDVTWIPLLADRQRRGHTAGPRWASARQYEFYSHPVCQSGKVSPNDEIFLRDSSIHLLIFRLPDLISESSSRICLREARRHKTDPGPWKTKLLGLRMQSQHGPSWENGR